MASEVLMGTCTIHDPDVQECINRLLAEGSLSPADVACWESLEAAIRTSALRRHERDLEERDEQWEHLLRDTLGESGWNSLIRQVRRYPWIKA